jgi:glutamate/tyrosine decarboxylase-like PLP-dependent enzyme
MSRDDCGPADSPVDDREWGEVLESAYSHVLSWRRSLADRPAFPTGTADDLRDLLTGGTPPEAGTDAIATLDVLARAGDLGSTASAGPRYFGYVIGSSLPVAVGADWLVTAWDQNATLYSCGPAVSVIEEVCADWLVKMLGLPGQTSAGFTTGTQMAAFTCLAAARHQLSARQGWDAETDGLWGAQPIPVLANEQRHGSIDRALRFLGMGTRVRNLGCDANGALDLSALRTELDRVDRPPIVCVQAGNINTGAVDPLRQVCELTHERGGWVHVDGAIGLWALASDEHRHLLDGARLADSWTTDAHKWLNVPFDCGIAFLAHPDAHRAAVGFTAAYLQASDHRDQINTVPEWSRRARSVPLYAVLRTLGRTGVASLIDRNIAHAQRIAALLAAEPGIEIVNQVVLNQVLVRFTAPDRDDDELTREIIARVQDDGTCWLSGSVFGNRAVMRISVCSAYTTTDDIRRSAEAIIRCSQDATAK